MDLGGAHQESLRAAKSVISGCGTVYINTVIYFLSSNTFLWNTPQIICILSIDCYYLFRLINHKSIFLTAVTNTLGPSTRYSRYIPWKELSLDSFIYCLYYLYDTYVNFILIRKNLLLATVLVRCDQKQMRVHCLLLGWGTYCRA
jgi:hypothetical protein